MCVRARVSSYTRVLENEDALSFFVVFFFFEEKGKKKRMVELFHCTSK